MVRALTELTDHERVQAMARFQVLRPFLEEDTALTDLARQHAYPLRTLRRWVQRYRTAGLAGLVRTLRRDRGTRRRLPLVLHQCVEGLALQTPPLSIALNHRQISALARQHNLKPLSYSLVYDIVRQLPCEAEAPNGIWQTDHCLLDILLVREGQAPAKPWLTVILDDYSRAMAGYPPQRLQIGGPEALAPGKPLTLYGTPPPTAWPGGAQPRHAWLRTAAAGGRRVLGEPLAQRTGSGCRRRRAAERARRKCR